MTAFDAFCLGHGLTPETRVSTTAGRQDLAALFAALGFTRGAEIGVWAGAYAETLCQANPRLRLIGVDAWAAYDGYDDPKNHAARLEAAYRDARTRLRPYHCDLRRMTSLAAAQTVPDGSLDFVYLDGNHGTAHVLSDLAAWTPKVRSGGIVSGHDYEVQKIHAHLHVREAVDTFTATRGIAPVYVLARAEKKTPPSFLWVQP